MSETNNKSEWVISYKQIGLLILVFIMGVVVALLLSNAQAGIPIAFTTIELVGFVLTVILSGASIVLAVSAIVLGKSSEQAVIKRSDESIRLQTEVFVKTNDALLRIESSTGVTEKRIEDIISGRAGDISQRAAEMTTSEGKRVQLDVKEIEENIRRSIENITKETSHEVQQKIELQKETKEKQEREYQKWREKLLMEIANSYDLKIEKIGEGVSPGGGDELFDGIFKKTDKRIAVSIFRPDIGPKMIKPYVDCAAAELSRGTVNIVFIILFGGEKQSQLVDMVKNQLKLLKAEISTNIVIKSITYEETIDFAKSLEL